MYEQLPQKTLLRNRQTTRMLTTGAALPLYVLLSFPLHLQQSQRKDVRAFFMSLRTMLPCLKCQNHYRQLLVKYPITDDHTRNAHKMSAWVEDMKRYIEQTKLEEPAHGHSHSGHGGHGHSHGHGGHGHSHGHGGHGHSHGHGGGHSHHQQQQQQQHYQQQQQHGGSRRAGYGTSSRSMRREDSLPRITGGAGGGAGAGGRSPRYGGGGGGRSPRYEQQAKASGGYGIRRGRVVSEQRVRRNDDDIWKREYQRVKADKVRVHWGAVPVPLAFKPSRLCSHTASLALALPCLHRSAVLRRLECDHVLTRLQPTNAVESTQAVAMASST